MIAPKANITRINWTIAAVCGLLSASACSSDTAGSDESDAVGGGIAASGAGGVGMSGAAGIGQALGGSATAGGSLSSSGGSNGVGGATLASGGAAAGAATLGGATNQGGASTVGGTAATQGGVAGRSSRSSGGAISSGGTNSAGSGTNGGQSSGGNASTGGGTSSGGASQGGASSDGGTSSSLENFSFFVASQVAMVQRGGPDGFGGDLRYGEATGLAGADKLCTEIAEASMPGAGSKGWRAFLSVSDDGSGNSVNAIDRIGDGPWYDRLGRLVASSKTALLNDRPSDADAEIINDLPNEDGVPNSLGVDNHDVLTGTTKEGTLSTTTSTCDNWTSTTASGQPQIGHAFPRSMGGNMGAPNWMSDHTAPGCAAGINTGTQNGTGNCVGCSGGYGAIYCFALTP